MNHSNFAEEIYDLYIVGALDAEEREQIDAHLRDGCEYCAERLHDAEKLAAAMAVRIPQVRPPEALRSRVLSTVAPRAARTSYWIPGLIAACLALLALSIWSFVRITAAGQQMAELRSERNDLRAALEMMSRPDTKAVQFGNIENAPHGRVFITKNGRVVFVGTRLPNLPAGKTFELWVIPAKGVPLPAGLFQPDPTGSAVEIGGAGLDVSSTAAVALTVEPREGSPAPTSKPFLVVPLG